MSVSRYYTDREEEGEEENRFFHESKDVIECEIIYFLLSKALQK